MCPLTQLLRLDFPLVTSMHATILPQHGSPKESAITLTDAMHADAKASPELRMDGGRRAWLSVLGGYVKCCKLSLPCLLTFYLSQFSGRILHLRGWELLRSVPRILHPQGNIQRVQYKLDWLDTSLPHILHGVAGREDARCGVLPSCAACGRNIVHLLVSTS